MRRLAPRIRTLLIISTVIAAAGLAYLLGYRAGFAARDEDRWAIVMVRRNANGIVTGNSYTWFDRKIPAEGKKLRAEEARLKSINADFYLAKGRMERTLSPEPDPRRASAHR